jgi:hypothetical protein
VLHSLVVRLVPLLKPLRFWVLSSLSRIHQRVKNRRIKLVWFALLRVDIFMCIVETAEKRRILYVQLVQLLDSSMESIAILASL